MKRICWILLVVTLVWNPFRADAQTMSGNLEAYVDSLIDNLPGSGTENYYNPSGSFQGFMQGTIDALLSGDTAAARTIALNFGYRIIEYWDSGTGNLYYVVEKNLPNNKNWGTYIINASPCRTNLVIQSPHPKYDYNTGKEGIYCFLKLGAVAYCLSGTHRCNSNQISSCSGVTSSCGTSGPFKVTDMPHSTEGLFQAATTGLLAYNSNMVFVQLHGFGKQPTDPYVILSNGTRETPNPDYILSIMSGLESADTSLSYKAAHLDTNWTRLIGFTNVQGRLINSSSDPCNTSATSTSGNFIHMEQEKTKLRDDSTGWYKVYQALATTFPCDSAVALRVSRHEAFNTRVYPSPSTGLFTVDGEGIEEIRIYNQTGQKVWQSAITDSTMEVDLTGRSPGLYLVVVRKFGINYTRKIVIQF